MFKTSDPVQQLKFKGKVYLVREGDWRQKAPGLSHCLSVPLPKRCYMQDSQEEERGIRAA